MHPRVSKKELRLPKLKKLLIRGSDSTPQVLERFLASRKGRIGYYSEPLYAKNANRSLNPARLPFQDTTAVVLHKYEPLDSVSLAPNLRHLYYSGDSQARPPIVRPILLNSTWSRFRLLKSIKLSEVESEAELNLSELPLLRAVALKRVLTLESVRLPPSVRALLVYDTLPRWCESIQELFADPEARLDSLSLRQVQTTRSLIKVLFQTIGFGRVSEFCLFVPRWTYGEPSSPLELDISGFSTFELEDSPSVGILSLRNPTRKLVELTVSQGYIDEGLVRQWPTPTGLRELNLTHVVAGDDRERVHRLVEELIIRSPNLQKGLCPPHAVLPKSLVYRSLQFCANMRVLKFSSTELGLDDHLEYVGRLSLPVTLKIVSFGARNADAKFLLLPFLVDLNLELEASFCGLSFNAESFPSLKRLIVRLYSQRVETPPKRLRIGPLPNLLEVSISFTSPTTAELLELPRLEKLQAMTPCEIILDAPRLLQLHMSTYVTLVVRTSMPRLIEISLEHQRALGIKVCKPLKALLPWIDPLQLVSVALPYPIEPHLKRLFGVAKLAGAFKVSQNLKAVRQPSNRAILRDGVPDIS